jgi:hypothetical protein
MSVVRARGLLAAAAGEDARRCQRSGGALRGSPGLVRSIMQMGSDGAGTARTVVIYSWIHPMR